VAPGGGPVRAPRGDPSCTGSRTWRHHPGSRRWWGIHGVGGLKGVSGHEDVEMTGQGPMRAAWAHGLSWHGESGDGLNSSPTSSSSTSRTKGSNAAGCRGWRDLDHRLLAALGRITERDRRLCRLLEDHRVLTTTQVADVGFSGERRARTRLSELYALDVLERFRPRTGANLASYHWVLGPLGAALVAAEAGVDVAELDWRRGLVHDLAASQRLAHLVGVNGFFSVLLRSARTWSGSRVGGVVVRAALWARVG
jgi:hypothetical protein